MNRTTEPPAYPRSILEGLPDVESVLGVGPAAGDLVGELTASGRAGRGETVEAGAGQISGAWDAVIYLGAHHALAADRGEEAARAFWGRLVASCRKVLLLDPGPLPEPRSRFERKRWQRRYGHRARNLFLSVGPRLAALDELASVPAPWPGMTQSVWRLDLRPPGGEFDLAAREAEFYGGRYSTSDRWEVQEVLVRTISTEAQKLIPSAETGTERVWPGTDFRVLRDRETGRRAFAKKIKNNPVQQMREFLLLESARHPRLIRLLEVHGDYGLVFPHLPWRPLREVDFRAAANRAGFRAEVAELYAFLRRTEVRTGLMDPSPGPSRQTSRRLDQLVDLNMHNFLVKTEGGTIADWAAIDLEPGWTDRTERNRANERKVLRLIDGAERGGLWGRLRRAFRGD